MTALNTTPTAHIRIDDRGVAYIDDLRFKVIHLAREYLTGYTPDEMYEAHKDVLSKAQVFAALSYYHDHQAEIDEQIRQGDEFAERMRKEAGEHPFERRMRESGKLS